MPKHFSHFTDTLKFTVKNKLWKGRREQMRFQLSFDSLQGFETVTSFSALKLLVGWQEAYPAGRKYWQQSVNVSLKNFGSNTKNHCNMDLFVHICVSVAAGCIYTSGVITQSARSSDRTGKSALETLLRRLTWWLHRLSP